VSVAFLPPEDEIFVAPQPKIADIVALVCADYDVSRLELLSPRRMKSLVEPRHVAMFLACRLTARSLPEIGQRLRRDHTTVIHGRDAIAVRIAFDRAFAARVERLARACRLKAAETQLTQTQRQLAEAERLAEAAEEENCRIEETRQEIASLLDELNAAQLRKLQSEAQAAQCAATLEREARELAARLAHTGPGRERDSLIERALALKDPRFDELARRHAFRLRSVDTHAERAASEGVAKALSRLSLIFKETHHGQPS